jgi:hypothetical protein
MSFLLIYEPPEAKTFTVSHCKKFSHQPPTFFLFVSLQSSFTTFISFSGIHLVILTEGSLLKANFDRLSYCPSSLLFQQSRRTFKYQLDALWAHNT